MSQDSDKGRGFSGLRELASDPGRAPQSKPVSRGTDSRSATGGKRVFPLLEMTKWPTLPAPWSSADRGETWVWDDFFFTFQKDPVMISDLAVGMQGGEPPFGGMTYHYAMPVYYRLDKNPHGPSNRPIMVIALEQLDMSKLTEVFGSRVASELLQSVLGSPSAPLMIGLFTGDCRVNLGEYVGETYTAEVREHFFQVLGNHLGLKGYPREIGDLADAHGHPETGLPAKQGIGSPSVAGTGELPGKDPKRNQADGAGHSVMVTWMVLLALLGVGVVFLSFLGG